MYRVGLKGLPGFEIFRYIAAKEEKPAPICLSAIFGMIDKKSRNHVQSFQSYAILWCPKKWSTKSKCWMELAYLAHWVHWRRCWRERPLRCHAMRWAVGGHRRLPRRLRHFEIVLPNPWAAAYSRHLQSLHSFCWNRSNISHFHSIERFCECRLNCFSFQIWSLICSPNWDSAPILRFRTNVECLASSRSVHGAPARARRVRRLSTRVGGEGIWEPNKFLASQMPQIPHYLAMKYLILIRR